MKTKAQILKLLYSTLGKSNEVTKDVESYFSTLPNELLNQSNKMVYMNILKHWDLSHSDLKQF